MKRSYILILILIIMLLLQITVFSFYPMTEVKPDLLLVVVVISSLLYGSEVGMKTGFGAGLLQDIFLGRIFGEYTIIKIVIGEITGIIEKKVYKGNLIIPPLIIFITTIIQEFIIILFIQKTVINIHYLNIMIKFIFPVALYNSIIGLFLYPVFLKIFKNKDSRLWIND
ncbi:MAG: rod shape-determining protein MreD [Halanaerobiales bacterium]